MKHPTRREALKQISVAGAGFVLAPAIIRAQGADLTMAGSPVEIAVTSLSKSTVRITVQPVAEGKPVAIPDDGVLVQSEWGKALARARVTTPLAHVASGDLTVHVAANPLVLTVEGPDGRTMQEFKFDDKAPGFSFHLPSGPLLGLGEGGSQFDRKGATDRMASGQVSYLPTTPRGYRLTTHGARVPIQWLVGTDGWGVYIHQPLGAFDFTGETGKFTPATASPVDLFVVVSSDPLVIMGEYARITGHPEMPALWTLGYLQSHRTLSGPEEVRWVGKTMREKKLPCDALIYLGTDFTPSGWNTHNGEFTWNPANFPDPKAMIDDLHGEHFKVVLHIVLEGQTLTGRVSDPCTAPALPPGRTPDGKWPPDRQVSCYWPAHKPLFDGGIDGWWPDQGDGLDGPSKLARIRMYWEGSQLWRPNERPFALHRNGYPGMQRYGAFLWSGDVYSTWETLKIHVADGVNTALSGVHLWGTDIGGFVPTAEYTGELHVRWFQFGAFCPLFRAHGRDWHLRLPWGWNTGELGVSEVANYSGGAANPPPSELHNPDVEPICRKYLELRYQLMPYLYSAVREAAQTGVPIVRAMWIYHPDDPIARSRGDQYFWGRDMIVAPVVEKGATVRNVYLPSGTWVDFWTEQSVGGGRELARQVDLATMPIYVRAGAILPMGPVRQYTAEPSDSPLTLVVYPGADGSFTLYEDDGESFAYRQGTWMGLAITWQDRDRQLRLRLAPNSRMLPPTTRPIEVRVAGSKVTQAVTFTGKAIDLKL